MCSTFSTDIYSWKGTGKGKPHLIYLYNSLICTIHMNYGCPKKGEDSKSEDNVDDNGVWKGYTHSSVFLSLISVPCSIS